MIEEGDEHLISLPQKHTVTMEFTRLPEVLLLKLSTQMQDTEGKDQRPFNFQSGLHIREQGKQERVGYNLRGVIVHRGESSKSGHYTSTVYEESAGRFCYYDDNKKPTYHGDRGLKDYFGTGQPQCMTAAMLIYERAN
jgi:ubiquitin C-terminal hydrolase